MEQKETREFLNQIYERLFRKALVVKAVLDKRAFVCECRFYNGHSEKNEDGKWQMAFYPIPIIEVKGLCDIEIGLDKISVSAKITRETALCFDYSKIGMYAFEIYGVHDYLNDFYNEGMKLEEGVERIRESDEREIGFSFVCPFEISGDDLCSLAERLKKYAFYN